MRVRHIAAIAGKIVDVYGCFVCLVSDNVIILKKIEVL